MIKDAENNITNYYYDRHNRMEKEEFADGSYIGYDYSYEGDLLSRKVYDSGGAVMKTQAFSYDAHRLTGDGIYTYTYDGGGGCACGDRIHTVTDSRGTTEYEYDFRGRVKKTTHPDGTIVESVYDEANKTKTVKLDGSTLFELSLDGEGRSTGVVEQVDGVNNQYVISRDPAGRIEEVQYPNNTSSETEYDNEGRITLHQNLLKGNVINKFDFRGPGYLDNEGNKLKEDTNIGVREYGYDDIYQLTSAVYERDQDF
ncbi:MAG: hypothetical protein ACOC4Y_01975, partial [bacterium]